MLLSETTAKQTIAELHLDGSRLRNLRKAELERLNDRIALLIKGGLSIEAALEQVVEI